MEEYIIRAVREVRVRSPDEYTAITESLSLLNEENIGRPWTIDDIISINDRVFYNHLKQVSTG